MPEDGCGLRTLRISRRVVRLAGVTVGLLVLVVGGFLASLSLDAMREAELVRLRLENRHLTENLVDIEGQVGLLSRTVDELSAQEQRFRLLAGSLLIPTAPPPIPINGGPTTRR